MFFCAQQNRTHTHKTKLRTRTAKQQQQLAHSNKHVNWTQLDDECSNFVPVCCKTHSLSGSVWGNKITVPLEVVGVGRSPQKTRHTQKNRANCAAICERVVCYRCTLPDHRECARTSHRGQGLTKLQNRMGVVKRTPPTTRSRLRDVSRLNLDTYVVNTNRDINLSLFI